VAGLALLAEIAPASAAVAEQGLVEGDLPLTPIERVFFESGFVAPNHWNQSLLVSVRGQLQPDALKAGVEAVLRHHDALRLRFHREGGAWRQVNAGMPDAAPFAYVDLSALSTSARSEALREHTLATQQSLDITRGPLLRVVYFDYGPGEPGRLLTVAHHLAVDRVSWRILLEDLSTAYEQGVRGEPLRLPLKTTSFLEWAHRLSEVAQSPAVREEAPYWLRLERAALAPLRFDRATGSNTEADARTATVYLDDAETESLLREAGQAYGMDAREILLAALAQAFEKWTSAPQLLVQVEGHGRQPEILGAAARVDLSRTIGWFTTLYPALFQLPAGSGPREVLLAAKEQSRSVPNGGIGFGLLRHLTQDGPLAERIAALPEPQVSFNYLGQFVQDASENSPFGPAPENSGPDHALANRRQCALDVTASVFGGRLRAEFTYSDAQFAAETMEMLADLFTESLRVLIQHCLSPEAGGYSASDFADAGLTDEGVQDLLLELGEIDD
jgi:non-ribosomal peptide synthase protein (TIGR01720 family)